MFSRTLVRRGRGWSVFQPSGRLWSGWGAAGLNLGPLEIRLWGELLTH